MKHAIISNAKPFTISSARTRCTRGTRTVRCTCRPPVGHPAPRSHAPGPQAGGPRAPHGLCPPGGDPTVPGPARNLPRDPVQIRRPHLSAGAQAGGPPPAHLFPRGTGAPTRHHFKTRHTVVKASSQPPYICATQSLPLSHQSPASSSSQSRPPTQQFLLVFLVSI